MNTAYIYLQLYRLFDRRTPVRADCGYLCGKACCRGSGLGMYLFPGEEAVYSLLSPDWIKLEQSEFTYAYRNKTHHLVFASCNGSCIRYERPLACRIFPLTPYIGQDGILEILVDPRAKSVCPLAKAFPLEDFDASFVESVTNAFRLLMKNERFRAFMTEYSAYLDDFKRFF